MSPASVCAMQRRVSSALKAPLAEASQAIREAEVVRKDETGWRLLRRKAWLWVTATERLAIFTVTCSRGGDVVRGILGEAFSGIVCSDRWSAYSFLDRRQQCWAHCLRGFVAMGERFYSHWHASRLIPCALEAMAAAAERDAGRITRKEMVERLEPVLERTQRYLRWTATNAPGEGARTKAREILKLEAHLWTFLSDPRVPVTNNLCERLLRYAVIWRKLSYGNQSEAGARFTERILSVCTSLQLQNRNVFAYLKEAVDAQFRGQPSPSVLPIGPRG